MSGCRPSTYRSIVFQTRIHRTGSDSFFVSRLEAVFGAVCWRLLTVLFSTWYWGGDSVLWVHANLVGNMAAFVARFGSPITNPNLLHFRLKCLFWRLSEDVRTHCCQRTWTTLHNQKPKYAIEQKNRPLQVKPIINGQKKCPYAFRKYAQQTAHSTILPLSQNIRTTQWLCDNYVEV